MMALLGIKENAIKKQLNSAVTLTTVTADSRSRGRHATVLKATQAYAVTEAGTALGAAVAAAILKPAL
jgi:hypothetical protein